MVTPDQELMLNIDCCSEAYRLVFLNYAAIKCRGRGLVALQPALP